MVPFFVHLCRHFRNSLAIEEYSCHHWLELRFHLYRIYTYTRTEGSPKHVDGIILTTSPSKRLSCCFIFLNFKTNKLDWCNSFGRRSSTQKPFRWWSLHPWRRSRSLLIEWSPTCQPSPGLATLIRVATYRSLTCSGSRPKVSTPSVITQILAALVMPWFCGSGTWSPPSCDSTHAILFVRNVYHRHGYL